MVSKANWKTWVILGVAVAVFATSAGVVVASNMGYKINKGLQNGFAAPGPKGDNWLSIPYNSPYTNSRLLCDAIFPGIAVANQGAGAVAQLRADTGAATSVNCNAGIGHYNLVDGGGIRVRITGNASPTLNPSNVVLVGSSDEAQALQGFQGAGVAGPIKGSFVAPGPKGDNWLSVAYHTTWVNASDACTTLGLGAGAGAIGRLNGPTGVTTACNCPCTIGNFGLVIGEAIRVRKTTAGDIAGLLPPHF